jgi:hypothetical protein
MGRKLTGDYLTPHLHFPINFHKGGYLRPKVITRDKRPTFFYMAEIILKPVQKFQILRTS